MQLTTRLHLVQRVIISGAVLLLPLYDFMAWRGTSPLNFWQRSSHWNNTSEVIPPTHLHVSYLNFCYFISGFSLIKRKSTKQEPPWKIAFARRLGYFLRKLKVHYRFHNRAFQAHKESGTSSTTLFLPDKFQYYHPIHASGSLHTTLWSFHAGSWRNLRLPALQAEVFHAEFTLHLMTVIRGLHIRPQYSDPPTCGNAGAALSTIFLSNAR